MKKRVDERSERLDERESMRHRRYERDLIKERKGKIWCVRFSQKKKNT